MQEKSDSESASTTPTPRQVDPWRFLGKTLAGMMESRIEGAPPHPPIPWAPVRKELRDSKISLLSTAGVSMRGDEPFDMEGERKNPTWGDPSWRSIDAGAGSADVEINHLHINTEFIQRDLNVALPLDRLRELVEEGLVGEMARNHYSIMGFQGRDSSTLENDSAPAIAAAMASEEVDLALLAPV